jgi:flagellin-specific chaperone FliS
MNAFRAYQQNKSTGWTRIDMLLTLFDATIRQTEEALAVVEASGPARAEILRHKARLGILALWAGVDNDGSELTRNLVNLYQFASNALAEGSAEKVRGALTVLRTLRKGFQGVREQAVELERAGAIPPIDAVCAIHAMG